MFKQVFDPDNLLWRILARAVDFVGLSLATVFCCLPVVTMIPAIAALYYTIVKVFREKEDEAFKLFFRAFKNNLKDGIIVNLICLPFMAIFAAGYKVMLSAADGGFGSMAFVIYYICLLIPAGWLVYICAVMGRFSQTKKELFKTSFQLCIAHIPSTLIIVLLSLELCIWTIEKWTPCFIAPSLWAILSSLFFEKIFKKHII